MRITRRALPPRAHRQGPGASRCRCSRRMAQFVLGDHMGGLTFEPPLGPAATRACCRTQRRPYAHEATATSARSSTTTSSGRASSRHRPRGDAAGGPALRDHRHPLAQHRRGLRDAGAAIIEQRTTAEWLGAARGGRHPGDAAAHRRRAARRPAPRTRRGFFTTSRASDRRARSARCGCRRRGRDSAARAGAPARRGSASTASRCCARPATAARRSMP